MIDIIPNEILHSLNPYFAVFVMAMMPIGEMRVSIPMGLSFYKLSISETLFISIMADIFIAFMLIHFASNFKEWARGRSGRLDVALERLFERTRRNFFHKHRVWGDLALMLLIAIPLPFTGVWTGALAAWLLEIPKREALLNITVGIIISAYIVTLISLGFVKLF